MNAGHKRPRRSLGLCPICGSDSGERRSDEDMARERHCIVCATCGARTFIYRTMGAATRAWNDGRTAQTKWPKSDGKA